MRRKVACRSGAPTPSEENKEGFSFPVMACSVAAGEIPAAIP
jgi:hypothetical protein